jgi:hypothetical protein
MKCGGTMQKGGTMNKMQKGGDVQKIVGMPGYNANTNTMQKGGVAKKSLTKAQMGTVVKDNKKIQKESAKRVKKGFKPVSGPSFKKGGATSFGMLSVKAGIDKNPKPTAADRIAGAKKKKK